MANAEVYLRGSCDIWQAPINTVTTLAGIPELDDPPPAADLGYDCREQHHRRRRNPGPHRNHRRRDGAQRNRRR